MFKRILLLILVGVVGGVGVRPADAQVMEFVPVSSTGPSTIVGNEIIIPEGGVQVQFDIFISGWGPVADGGELYSFIARFDASSLLGANAFPTNAGVDLGYPVPAPCDSDAGCATGLCGSFAPGLCDDSMPAFQFRSACLDDSSIPCSSGSQCPGIPVCIDNPNFILTGTCQPLLVVSIPPDGNFAWLGACSGLLVPDPGMPRLAGSLRVDVPLTAKGAYTIAFDDSPTKSFLTDSNAIPIPGLTLIDGVVTLPIDCNGNGMDDADEIAAGLATDCDGNGLLDECEFTDCNDNGVLDRCDITNMTSLDCSSDGIPDECQLIANDCNNDDVPDDCQLPFNDCNDNGIPDECDPNEDCNDNGVQDTCDVAAGAPDCNFNEVPDGCEPDEDCNTNGVRDICDIGAGTSLDCNGNNVPDDCDLSTGSSPDTNGNDVPDECDVVAPRIPDPPHDWRKNRFISFTPVVSAGIPIAYRVDLLNRLCATSGKKCTISSDCTVCDGGDQLGRVCTHRSDCPGANCAISGEPCVENGPPIALGWVGDPVEVPEDADARIPPGLFTSQVVRDQPSPRLWPEAVVHIGDCEIAPAQSYALRATTGDILSEPLLIGTVPRPQDKLWGDVGGEPLDTNGSGAADSWSPPNGLVNVNDILAWLKFKAGRPEAPHITALELDGEVPNFIANVTDLALILQGFQGLSYPPPPFPTKVCQGGNDGALCMMDSECAGGTCTGWNPLRCP